MPKSKVAYFSGIGGRAEFMIGQAPPDLEVRVVDPSLSDEEKAHLCGDADAIISVENPLLDLDNVVITPHMAGQSRETNLRAADFAYSNIMRVLAGEPPESLFTPE